MTSAELKAIGARIFEKRKQLGLTQEQVAEQMDVSIQMVSNLERGNKAIKIDNLIKISRILGVSTDYILTGLQSSADAEQATAKITKLSARDAEAVTLLIDFFNSQTP